MDHMTNEERKIYDLVVRRFLSVLYPPFEYEQTTVKSVCGEEIFVARGKIVKNTGWKAVYENDLDTDDEDDCWGTSERVTDQVLPHLEKGIFIQYKRLN